MTKMGKTAVLFCLSATLCFCTLGWTGTSLVAVNSGNAEQHTVEALSIQVDSGLNNTYLYGDSITFTEFESEYNGSTVLFRPSYCIFPSGKTVFATGTLTLEEAGKYTIVYTGNAGGATVTAEEEITVCNPLYTIGENSSASYGTIPQDYYEQYVRVKDINDLDTKEGLYLQLAGGETFTYNRVINLSGYTFDDPIISMFCLPETQGQADAASIHLRLTDIYNADNYVDLYIYSMSKESACDHLAAFALGFNGNMTYEALWSHGGLARFSLNLDSEHVGSMFNLFQLIYEDSSLTFDTQPRIHNEQILTGAHNFPSFTDTENNHRYWMDIDEPWGGFTTGECRLTIESSGLTASRLGLMIYDIGGETLDADYWEDDTIPAFSVDYAGYDSDALPNASVGNAYKLFEATAYSGQNVDVKVYYNYRSDNAVLIRTDNGYFTPAYEGLYTIVYSLTGSNGITNQVICDVYADKEACFDFSLKGRLITGKSGNSVRLFDSIEQTGSLHGVVKYDIAAVHKASGKTYFISSDDQTFMPMDAGNYTVTVTGRDYVTTRTKEYALQIIAGDTPLIEEEAIVPLYFIKGATYSIEPLYGYVFSSGYATEAEAAISVYEDDSLQAISLDNGKYTVSADSTVRIVYTLTDPISGKSVEKEYTGEVVDTGFGTALDGTKYFKMTEGSYSASGGNSGISFATSAQSSTDGEIAFTFINAVQTKNFLLNFTGIDGMTDFVSFDVYLTDVADNSNIVKISFFNQNGSTYVRINNDSETYAMDGNLFSGAFATLSIGYSADSRSVILNNTSTSSAMKILIKNNFAGEPFAGFGKNRAYLSFALTGIEGDAGVMLTRINNQSLALLEEDWVLPEFFTDVDGGMKDLGTTVRIGAADIADVLDPNVSIALTVTSPSGQTVMSLEGVSLSGADGKASYTFITEELGIYSIRYTVSDSENTRSYSYAVSVAQNIVPTLNVKGEIVSEASVGDTIALPDAQVSEGAVLDVWLSCPGSGALQSLLDANGNVYDGFVATRVGTYKIYYAVRDNAGNFLTQVYTVTVK